MNTTIDSATRTVNDLLDQREQLVARAGKLAAERQKISYAAHTGNKSAQDKLRKVNDQTVLHGAELEGVDLAIAEARQRLAQAEHNAVIAADQANAAQLQALVGELTEICTEVDLALIDAAEHLASIPALLDKIHALGCSHPTHQQYAVLGGQALKTAMMNFKGFAREFEHIAPSSRRTFQSLGVAWASAITNNIAARLGEMQKKDAA
jgi:hypothetical protein